MTESEIENFRNTVLAYFQQHGRHNLPWRLPEPDSQFDPYKIMVSEIMLQQTQVPRVIPKYLAFIDRFPTVEALAGTTLAEVLTAWSGLGYNRRAKFLYQAAQLIANDFNGIFPTTVEKLVKLPGVGRNTAGAVLAYAFNQPAIFVETNIRTVYIHHFFHDRTDIGEHEIVALLQHTLDKAEPRIFYWSLMDYGSHLKQIVGNLNKLSKSYTKQTAFPGSLRQIRGQVIRLLTQASYPRVDLLKVISDERLPLVLTALEDEGLIKFVDDRYSLA